MEIHLAKREDLEEVVPLFGAYLQFYGKEFDSAKSRDFLEERLKAKDSVIFIARVRESGRVAGFAQLYASWSSLAQRKSWILNDLYVGFDFRRKGLAKELVQACMKFSNESGAKGLTLQTSRENHEAQSLYRVLGWLRDEEFITYYFDHRESE